MSTELLSTRVAERPLGNAATSDLLYEALEISPEVAPFRQLMMSQMGLIDLGD